MPALCSFLSTLPSANPSPPSTNHQRDSSAPAPPKLLHPPARPVALHRLAAPPTARAYLQPRTRARRDDQTLTHLRHNSHAVSQARDHRMSEFTVPVFHVIENYKFVGCQTLLQEEQRLLLTKVVSNVRRVCCGWDDGLRSIIASNSEERRGMQQKK
jgi:hypothetical protein